MQCSPGKKVFKFGVGEKLKSIESLFALLFGSN